MVAELRLDYLTQQRGAGESGLASVFIRHVIVAGPVDIGGLQRSPRGASSDAPYVRDALDE